MKKLSALFVAILIAVLSLLVMPVNNIAFANMPDDDHDGNHRHIVVHQNGHWWKITLNAAGGPIEVVIDDPNH